VTVDYEFLNTTGQDITTEVAFPVPEYNIYSFFTAGPRDLEGWHVWVEGAELKYQTETRAELDGVDYTDMLKRMSIDIASFGHWDQTPEGKAAGEVRRLGKGQQAELARAGLVMDELPVERAQNLSLAAAFSVEKDPSCSARVRAGTGARAP
jgi:hypothetical protein